MPTEPEVSVVGTEEPKGPPAPEISPASTSQPPSPVVDADAIVERVVSRLDEVLDRKLQSTKDRRFADLEKVKAALDESGGDPKKAARQLAIDQLLEQQTSQMPVPGRTDDEDFDELYAGILANRNISPDDVELAEWVGSTKFGSKKAFLGAVREKAERMKSQREKQGKAGSPAAVITDAAGKPPAPPGDVESLTKDYYKDMLAARGDAATVRSTKEKYRKLGVPVDQVVF